MLPFQPAIIRRSAATLSNQNIDKELLPEPQGILWLKFIQQEKKKLFQYPILLTQSIYMVIIKRTHVVNDISDTFQFQNAVQNIPIKYTS